MNEDKCPVCGNKEGFHIVASGSEWASLISYGLGQITLIACSECGCVYASEWDRGKNKKLEEERANRWKAQ